MEYEGYITRDIILQRVEKYFPFVNKPSVDDFYVFDEDDVMRKIIESGISKHMAPELPYEGVMILYDEFSTISQKAVEWLLPSLLRIILKKKDTSKNLHWFLPSYFENIDSEKQNSAYNFSWLSKEQLSVLNSVFEYLSEEYGCSVALAQEKLLELEAET